MANRIPPSLNWLIDKRARVAGEIKKIKRLLDKTQDLVKELEGLETKLNAIDTTLELHDIKVDINLIQPIESKDLKLTIPRGELTKSILTCIRLYQNGGPVSKEVISNFVIAKHFDFENGQNVPMGKIRESIQNRLAGLYHKGYLVRHHPTVTGAQGLWTLTDPKSNID